MTQRFFLIQGLLIGRWQRPEVGHGHTEMCTLDRFTRGIMHEDLPEHLVVRVVVDPVAHLDNPRNGTLGHGRHRRVAAVIELQQHIHGRRRRLGIGNPQDGGRHRTLLGPCHISLCGSVLDGKGLPHSGLHRQHGHGTSIDHRDRQDGRKQNNNQTMHHDSTAVV